MPPAAVADLAGRGVARFLFTPIEVDGTMAGPGIDELRQVADASEARIIYSGGVGDLDDLRSLAAAAPENVEGGDRRQGALRGRLHRRRRRPGAEPGLGPFTAPPSAAIVAART